MIERKELSQQWLTIAGEDLNVAELTHANGYWLYAAYLCHQALEKTIKGYWVATRNDTPPYTHNHAKLLEGCGLMSKLDDDQMRFIAMMIPMYIEARYPSYKQRIASTLNEQASRYILETTKQLTQWIKEKL